MVASSRVLARIAQQVRRYQSILTAARSRDVSEADTVSIIRDMLADVLGYNKFSEVTTELAIRGTFVDLAVTVEESIRFLVEVKAIGIELKDNHVRQAIDYGANKGIEWVVLTNGIRWRVYRILFKQPIDKSLVFECDLVETSAKDNQLLECFGNISREGYTPSSMNEFYQQRQAVSRFTIGALLVSEPVLDVLRRELRRIAPSVKVDEEFLRDVLENEVIKRDLLDSEHTAEAKKLVRKSRKVTLRQVRKAVNEKPASLDAVESESAGEQV
ncbi:MAG: type I restriction enzyme HsdR N-terminal domain-containing protein [Dongiaceae bacterium]